MKINEAQRADQAKGIFMSEKKLYRLLVEVDESQQEAFERMLDQFVTDEMTESDYIVLCERRSAMGTGTGWETTAAHTDAIPIIRWSALNSDVS
jgi:hypothetical protein